MGADGTWGPGWPRKWSILIPIPAVIRYGWQEREGSLFPATMAVFLLDEWDNTGWWGLACRRGLRPLCSTSCHRHWDGVGSTWTVWSEGESVS